MITLKQITYMLAVAETLHFKRAAELCSISQSALSTAILEMENQLGFQVFERDNKKVLITPIGEQCLDKARSIKIQMEDLYQMGQALKSPLSYPMSIGVIPTIGPYLLPIVMPSVRHGYPEFRLSIIEQQSKVLVNKVRLGEIDAAILALPFDIEGLLAFEFWQEDFYWITHRDDHHALQQEITSEELAESHLMLLEDGHCLKDHALAACKLQPRDTGISMESTSLNTLVQMVAGHMGSTLVPAMSLDQLLSGNEELSAVHLNEPGPHRRLAFIIRPNYPGVKSIEMLIQLFQWELQKQEINM